MGSIPVAGAKYKGGLYKSPPLSFTFVHRIEPLEFATAEQIQRLRKVFFDYYCILAQTVIPVAST